MNGPLLKRKKSEEKFELCNPNTFNDLQWKSSAFNNKLKKFNCQNTIAHII